MLGVEPPVQKCDTGPGCTYIAAIPPFFYLDPVGRQGAGGVSGSPVPSVSSAGNHLIAGSRMAGGSVGKSGCRAIHFLSYVYVDDLHRVIAEDVYHLDSDLPPAGFTLFIDALEFQCAVTAGPEGLPLVLKNIFTGPDLHGCTVFGFDADNLFFALEIEIDGPIINPIFP